MRHWIGGIGLVMMLAAISACGSPAWVGVNDATVIVVPKSACQVVDLAARELQYYVEKATGVKMPILSEDGLPPAGASRIYVGATRAALKAGINSAAMPRDAYRIRAVGQVAYLVGSDGDGDPLQLATPAGTLFAVYDVLDRDLGVRWLWPGKSGEVVPKSRAFKIRDRDEKVLPRFRFCGLRSDRPEEMRWMRRMRMHGADGIDYGHAFGKWADMVGALHPDWFEMNKNGARVFGKSMCVSNPGFQKQIVDNWWTDEKNRHGHRQNVNVCENDGPGACCCPNCLAWDGPAPPWPRPTPYDNVHNVSQRYARFEMAVLKLAREHDPNAEVTAYAYSNMFFAPVGVKMDKGILIGFVPDVFFPRTPEQQDWVHRQWKGWVDAGASLFLRPNYLLNGYCMPVNWTRQLADDFQYFAKQGMIGTDFDSLTGMWSTMGQSLYVLGRLHGDPDAPVDKILNEYYRAFGPAANYVKAYWEYWERHDLEHIAAMQDSLWFYVRYADHLDKRYPPDCFDPAEKLMAEAERAAAKYPEAAARVAFLKTGLTHAKLCVEASIAFEKAGDDVEKRKAAVAELLAFRKTITDPMIVNLSDGDDSCRAREMNLEWPE